MKTTHQVVPSGNSCPFVRPDDKDLFFVTAKHDFQAKTLIRKGDHILIDPNEVPIDGRWVLVGMNLETWTGQSNVRGVAVSVHSEVI